MKAHRHTAHSHEHEFEPEFGLPEKLPAGERILWQGAPAFGLLARHAFHLRKLAVYFAVLLGLQVAQALSQGAGLVEALAVLRWSLPVALLALGAVALLAWLTARTAVYTLTDKRVVMRIGIVLTLAFNLPLKRIAAADIRRAGGRAIDLSLRIAGDDRIAWLHLWPHARPWRMTRPEPMLRGLADAEHVAALLAQAWSAETGASVAPLAEPVSVASGPSATPADGHAGGQGRLQPSAG
jgi:hypothetical protein